MEEQAVFRARASGKTFNRRILNWIKTASRRPGNRRSQHIPLRNCIPAFLNLLNHIINKREGISYQMSYTESNNSSVPKGMHIVRNSITSADAQFLEIIFRTLLTEEKSSQDQKNAARIHYPQQYYIVSRQS
jgi:hypothetical protein